MKKQIVPALVLVTLFTSFFGCTKKSQNEQAANSDTIVVGEVGSLSGSEATFGLSTHEGIELAIKQLNESGGIKGKKIKVLTLDNQGKPEEAATAATKLITQDHVVALLGEVASSRSLAMAPIAQANHVPMVSPSSTNPRVTKVGDYIFRVCFIDPFQGSVMAKFARETLKAKTAAILRDVKNDYSVGLSDFFKETFEKMGGQVVADQSYSAGDVDFKSQLTGIKTKTPDVIFVPGYYTEVGLIARQAREIGLKSSLLGGDGWDSTKLTEIGGAALDGSYFSNHYSQEDKSEAVVKFVDDYKKVYGKAPDGLAAMGYDAMMVLAAAMKRAPTLSGSDLKSALAATVNHPGVTGKITIDKDRNAVKPAVILEVKAQQFKFKQSINPST